MILEKTIAEQRNDDWRAAALRARRTPAGSLACRQGFVLTPAQARATGMAASEPRRLVRRGDWTAPHRGVLCVLPSPDGVRCVHGMRPEVRAAAVALVRTDAVISHECAALARGLDVLTTPNRATLTTESRAHAVSLTTAVVHAAALDEAEIDRWFGAPITNCARTVADIARISARDGLVVADSALLNELVTMDELRAAIERQYRWHGVTDARRVLELASPLSESALESLTRLFVADHGVPLPEQQRWIETHRGWYRVDGLWERERAILEADGLRKYRTERALPAEKIRQEALERAGDEVVRIMWRDLFYEPAETLARIWNALR